MQIWLLPGLSQQHLAIWRYVVILHDRIVPHGAFAVSGIVNQPVVSSPPVTGQCAYSQRYLTGTTLGQYDINNGAGCAHQQRAVSTMQSTAVECCTTCRQMHPRHECWIYDNELVNISQLPCQCLSGCREIITPAQRLSGGALQSHSQTSSPFPPQLMHWLLQGLPQASPHHNLLQQLQLGHLNLLHQLLQCPRQSRHPQH